MCFEACESSRTPQCCRAYGDSGTPEVSSTRPFYDFTHLWLLLANDAGGLHAALEITKSGHSSFDRGKFGPERLAGYLVKLLTKH